MFGNVIDDGIACHFEALRSHRSLAGDLEASELGKKKYTYKKSTLDG